MSAHDNGPRFIINIEGAEHPWDSSTITLAELRQLAGWESTQQVVEVDLQSMTETTIELKPGHGFAKKIRFQRG
jgi:hypothetical protein